MPTDLVYHELFAKHVIAEGHPERPERVLIALKSISDRGILRSGEVGVVTPPKAVMEHVLAVHDEDYLSQIEQMSRQGGGYFTSDTGVNSYTYDAAMYAAGGAVNLVQRIWEGTSQNGFLLCRPPGHHAERDRAFGFCFINNIAVAAQYLVDNLHLHRVMIVDYDAHHGNGTQNAFYSTDKVLYVTLQQDGRTLFPGSGSVEETGEGEGEGYTVNLPVYPGAGDKSFELLFGDIIEPVADVYKPQFVLVSAGFDCHFSDPLTNLGLTTSGIAMMNTRLKRIAERHSNGRLAFFLEGGYNLDVIARTSVNLMEELCNEEITLFNDRHNESTLCLDTTRRLSTEIRRRFEGRFF